MTDADADVALACVAAFVDGLVEAGVREACLSPGSRSTPLALALWRHPKVRVHVHLDERSSGFFGLGLAKASGDPVAIACTSGTAAANLLPAVVEASMSRVPLVVLTADRPPELRGVGANQTIDQVELYGRYARRFVDAPVPNEEPSGEAWLRRGRQAAATATSRPLGPVHVNLPFREPLVPDLPSLAGGRGSANAPDSPSPVGSPDLGPLLEDLAGARRGLVYAGGLRAGGEDLSAVADALGWPLVAEPHSGARRRGSLSGGTFLLQSDRFVEAHTPQVVLQVGAAPTSRAGLALLERVGRLLILDPDEVVGDPLRRASRRLVAGVDAVRSALGSVEVEPDDGWSRMWREASGRARSAVDALLDGWQEPFEGRVARDVADAVPEGGDLCVGSSLPIRDLDLFMRPREDLRVLANRGASGIDGFVSTTLGVSAAGAATVGLFGDLTLIHDVGALVWNARRDLDAVLVVPNNGGGAIFSLLEQRSLPELDELFTTPHRVGLEAVVRAAGAGYVRAERSSDLVPAVRRAIDAGGVHVVEVPIDRERDRSRRADVRSAIEETVG
jgi:2-succinyl-5-enolpyruvyl-6-hydroxy-3-cyclohexene-1-carboxylate synthase